MEKQVREKQTIKRTNRQKKKAHQKSQSVWKKKKKKMKKNGNQAAFRLTFIVKNIIFGKNDKL